MYATTISSVSALRVVWHSRWRARLMLPDDQTQASDRCAAGSALKLMHARAKPAACVDSVEAGLQSRGGVGFGWGLHWRSNGERRQLVFYSIFWHIKPV